MGLNRLTRPDSPVSRPGRVTQPDSPALRSRRGDWSDEMQPAETPVSELGRVTLRPYQAGAVTAIESEFAAGRRRTLVVLPTGAGKTVVFSEVIRREVGGRALVLAHRTELLEQGLHKLTACGVRAQIEQGGRRATPDASCVVASVQTLRGARLERWDRDSFDLIVIDEAHHATAAGYQAIVERFPGARLLGVTATPDRLDGQGLGTVFESVAYRYELRQAIRDGWLAPIRARRVEVQGLDLAGVHTRAGDLDPRELAATMATEATLHGIAAPLLELAGARLTIVFAVNVAHGRALAEVLNRYRPGVARAVDGTMGASERLTALTDFAAGRFQILANVALLTEGFDCPAVSCIAMARPTKSRALYTQCVGRATRLAPGKADCLVLDFTGQAGRHRLVGPADVLAGRDLGDELRAEMAALLRTGAGDLDDVLELAESNVEDRRVQAAITAVARYRAEEIDPFVGDLPNAPNTPWAGDLATDKQREALARAGLEEVPAELTKGEASRWLDAIAARRMQGLATIKQVRFLRRYGVDARAMLMVEATAEIDTIKARGWRREYAA